MLSVSFPITAIHAHSYTQQDVGPLCQRADCQWVLRMRFQNTAAFAAQKSAICQESKKKTKNICLIGTVNS